MSTECARRCELAELVADHLLRDEDGHVLTAVVDGDRVADHLREDGRAARPGADHVLLTRLVHRGDPLQQALLHERSLLRATRHLATSFLSAPTAADDELVRLLVLCTRALAKRRHAPRCDRMAAALRLALAAAVRVVDRVHRRAAHGGALALPAAAAGLAARDVLVVDVADLSDGGPARERDAAHLARRKAEHRMRAVLRDELHARARRARHFRALPRL